MCHTIVWVCALMTAFSWVPDQLLEPGRSKYVISSYFFFHFQPDDQWTLVLKFGRYPRIPRLYLKISKLMSLILDATLNLYFMRIVQKQLIEPGLDKYKPLVIHNFRIVCIALLMDVSFWPCISICQDFEHQLYRFTGRRDHILPPE